MASQKQARQKVSAYTALVDWWVRITSPEKSKYPQWQEKLASLMIPFIILLVIAAIPLNINGTPVLIILFVVMLLDIFAIFLKKWGFLRLAGILIIGTIEMGLAISCITPGVSSTEICYPLLDQMAQTLLVVAAFFPAEFIFVIMTINTAFIFFIYHQTSQIVLLNETIPHKGNFLLIGSIQVQIIIGCLAYFIIKTMQEAIQRANQAEKIAELERLETERQRQELDLKNDLEEGINKVLTTLNQVANGNLDARVPVSTENVLYRISYAINTVLLRLSSYKQDREELAKTRQIVPLLLASIKKKQAIHITQWTGTCLDPLILELSHRQEAPHLPDAKNPPSGPTTGHDLKMDRV